MVMVILMPEKGMEDLVSILQVWLTFRRFHSLKVGVHIASAPLFLGRAAMISFGYLLLHEYIFYM